MAVAAVAALLLTATACFPSTQGRQRVCVFQTSDCRNTGTKPRPTVKPSDLPKIKLETGCTKERPCLVFTKGPDGEPRIECPLCDKGGGK